MAKKKLSQREAADRLKALSSGEIKPDPISQEEYNYLMKSSSEEIFGRVRGANQPSRFIKPKYMKVTDPLSQSYNEMEKAAQDEQNWAEVTGNMLGQFATGTLAGFIDGFTPLDVFSVKENLSTSNTSKQFGNSLNLATQNIMEWGQEMFPIYNANPEKVFTGEYLANMLGGQGYTAGIFLNTMVQSYGFGALGAIGKGAINGAKMLRATKALGVSAKALDTTLDVARGAEAAIGASKAWKTVGKAAVMGTMNGLQETYLNTLETGRAEYDKYEKAFGQEFAAKKAREAMQKHAAYETGPAVLLNALSWGITAKLVNAKKFGFGSGRVNAPTGYSDTFSSVAESVFGKLIKNKTGQKVAGALTAMTSEGFEEGVQYAAGALASYDTDEKYNVYRDEDGNTKKFSEAGKTRADYVFNNELRDSAISGFVGGGIFSGGRHLFEKRRMKGIEKQIEANLQATAEVQKNLTLAISSKIKEVESLKKSSEAAQGNEKDVFNGLLQISEAELKNLEDQLALTTAQAAISNDYIKGDDNFTTFNLLMANMQKAVDAVENGDQETLKKFGFEDIEVQNYVKENYSRVIETATEMKDKIVDSLATQMKLHGKEEYYIAEKIAYHGFVAERSKKAMEDIHKSIGEVQKSVSTNLSEEQLNYLNALSKKEAYERQAGSLTQQQKKDRNENLNTISEFEKLENFEEDFGKLEPVSSVVDKFTIGLEYEAQKQKSQEEASKLYDQKYAEEYKKKKEISNIEKELEDEKSTIEKVEKLDEKLDKLWRTGLYEKQTIERLKKKAEEKKVKIKNDAATVAARLEEQEKKRQEKAETQKQKKEAEEANAATAEPKTTIKPKSKSRVKKALTQADSEKKSGKKYTVAESDDLFEDDQASGLSFSPVKSENVSDEVREALIEEAKDFESDDFLEYVQNLLSGEDGLPQDLLEDAFSLLASTFFEAKGIDKSKWQKLEREAYNHFFGESKQKKVGRLLMRAKEEQKKKGDSVLPPEVRQGTAQVPATNTSVQQEDVSDSEEAPAQEGEEDSDFQDKTGTVVFTGEYAAEDGVTPVKYTGDKTAEATLKVPFSGQAYADEVTEDSEGQITVNTESVDDVADNEENILLRAIAERKKERGEDAEAYLERKRKERENRKNFLLNPSTARKGTKVMVYIPSNEELMDEIVVSWTRDSKGVLRRNLTTFGKWLEERAKAGSPVEVGSDEWLGKVPVLMQVEVNGQFIPVGNAFHETDWWNEKNVADFSKVAEWTEGVRKDAQDKVISEGKEKTLSARRRVWQETIKGSARGSRVVGVEMEISDVSGGRSLKTEKHRPLVESNSDLSIVPIVTTSVGNTTKIVIPKAIDAEGNVTEVYTEEDIINYDSVISGYNIGKTYTLIPYREVPYTTSEGQVKYRTVYLAQFAVTNSPLAQKVFDKIFQTKILILGNGRDVKGILPTLRELRDQGKTIKEMRESVAGKNLKRIFELIGRADSFDSFLENLDNQKIIDKYITGMYPRWNSERKEFVASVTKRYLPGGDIPGNLVVWEPAVKDTEGNTVQEGQFKLYESNTGETSEDSPYVQMLKDTLYSKNEYVEITDLATGNKKKISNVQPRIELDFTSAGTSSTVLPSNTTSGIKPSQEKSGQKESVQNEDVTDTTEETSEDISEISDGQRDLVVQNLYHRILRKLSSMDSFTEEDIYNVLRTSMDNLLEDMKRDYPKEYSYLLAEKDAILGLGSHSGDSGTVREILLERFRISDDSFNETIEEQESVLEEDSGIEKDYSKSNLEYSAKTSMSDRVKIAFSAIPVAKERRSLPEFGGLEEYMEVDDVFSAVQDILADVPNSEETLSQRIREKVAKNSIEFGFLEHVANIFDNLRPEFKMEMLFLLNQTRVDMHFIYASEYNSAGVMEYKLQVLDANSRNPVVGTKIAYGENLKLSKMVNITGKNSYRLNEEVALKVKDTLDRYIKAKDNEKPSPRELANTLEFFGIDVYPDILENLYTEGFFETLQSGLLRKLSDNIKYLLVQQKNPSKSFDFSSTNENVLYRETGNYLKVDFITKVIEKTFNVDQTLYVAGKTINSFSQPNLGTEQMRKLRAMTPEDIEKEGSLAHNLLRSNYSKHSYLLHLITAMSSGKLTETSKKILREMNISFVSLDALKRKGFKGNDKNGLTDLSSIDYDIAQLGAFMDMGVKIPSGQYEDLGLSLRMARMFFPSLSDSSQMLLFKSPVFDIKYSNLTKKINPDGTSTITGIGAAVEKVLYEQLVLPELERMIDVYHEGNSPFGEGGKMFLSTPALNMVTDSSGVTILQALAGNTIADRESFFNNIKERFGENLKKKISEVVKAEAESYLRVEEFFTLSGTWVRNGFVEVKGGTAKLNILDSSFLNTKADKEAKVDDVTKLQVAAYDFAINNMLSQAQIQMLFVSDIANYAKVNLSGFNNGNIADPKGETEQEKKEQYLAITKATSNVLSKRLKAVISPGNRKANSEGQKYYQLMIEDIEEPSNLFHQYVSLWYGEEEANKNKEAFDKLYETIKKIRDYNRGFENTAETNPLRNSSEIAELKKEASSLIKELKKKFPAVAGYLKNTATDAQEYTTWREHLLILKDTGKITQAQYDTIKAKLTSQSRDGVNEDNKLTKEEKVAFQPIKPLYSGMHFDEGKESLYQKQLYVKSSSFPLLPEMTYGLGLDNLRKNMENLEVVVDDEVVVPVRASYQTANKVGAVRTPANFDMLTSKVLEKGALATSVIEMSRENFSIQQEKPDKTAKNLAKGKRDEINIGTQIEKLLLGSGISKNSEKIFENRFSAELIERINASLPENVEKIEVVDNKISGVDLNKIYTNLYIQLESTKRDILLESLDIDKDSFELGSISSMERLRSALSERLTNKQDKEILELRYIVERNGRRKSFTKAQIDANPELKPTKAEFSFPIWLTPNSRKFESVLNAIVGNELVKLKLPGNSFIVGSSQGTTKSVSLTDVSTETRSGITWLSKEISEQEELLPERLDENGKVLPAQVVIASKFRKKVKQEDGTYKEELVDFSNSGLLDANGYIDTSKVDPSVLELMSFRIPTSAHQSGSLLQIVGFLPPESTDLMLVPKEHTVKLGEDFDIDARYTYSGNYDVKTAEDGSVVSISFLKEDSVDVAIKAEQHKAYLEYKANIEEYLNDLPQNVRDIINNDFITTDGKKFAAQYIMLTSELAAVTREIENSTEVDAALVNTQKELQRTLTELENQNIKRFFKKSDSYADIKEGLNIFLENFQSEKEKIAMEYSVSKIRKQRSLKTIENDIISVYKSIYSSSDNGVRKLVNSTINTDLSETTVAEMDKVTSTDNADTFSIFAGSHQKAVLTLGASGKMGIGVHSNWVVFNSLLQQLEEPFHLIKQDKDGVWGNFSIRFGNFQSDGQLGILEALPPRVTSGMSSEARKRYESLAKELRTTADINMENQNSSTDNQNKGVMGRRNENKYTINVFALMCNLGFDKDFVNGELMHLPSLFLNQPILRRYVELMEENSSLFTEYNSDLNKYITETLKQEFTTERTEFADEESNFLSPEAMEKASNAMSAQGLFDNLSDSSDPNFQWAVFSKFLELQSYSEDLVNIQKYSNMRGLGKSYFDTIGVKNAILNNMLSRENGFAEGVKIRGVEQLFGESLQETLYDNPEGREIAKDLIEKGYVYLGVNDNEELILRRPTSPNNAKILYALSTGYHLWGNVFPYENDAISRQIETVLAGAGKSGNYGPKAMDIRFDVKNNMQDFLYSYANLGIFRDEQGRPGDISEERRRLFMDGYDSENKRIPGEESLATYLNSLKMLKNQEEVLDEDLKARHKAAVELFNKTFFKNLIFEISRDEPSIIKYNVSEVNSINKNRPHTDLLQMLGSEVKLPPFRGDENYTVGKLLKDLTKYTLLSKTENGAIGFRNHIPMAVFKEYNLDAEMIDFGKLTINGGRLFNLLFNGTAQAISVIARGRIETNSSGIPIYIRLNEEGNFNEENLRWTIDNINNSLGEEIYTLDLENKKVDIKSSPFNAPIGRFVRQYYQHNPGNAEKIGFKELGIANRKSVATTKSFRKVYPNSSEKPDYISVVGGGGKIYLFEASDQKLLLEGAVITYTQINTLGGTGVNEYNPNADVNTSMFAENNVSEKAVALENRKRKKTNTTESPRTLEAALQEVEKIATGEQGSRAKTILNFLTENNLISGISFQTIEREKNSIYGLYDSKTNTIMMNKAWENTEEYVVALAEEAIHAVTSGYLRQHLNLSSGVLPILFNGTSFSVNADIYTGDNTPAEIVNLMLTLKEASSHFFSEIQKRSGVTMTEAYKMVTAYTEWLLSSNKTSNNAPYFGNLEVFKDNPEAGREFDRFVKNVAYRLTSVEEFVAGAIDDGDFKKELAKVPYKNTDKSLLERFADFVLKMVKRLSSENTLDQRATEAVFNVIMKSQPKPRATETLSETSVPSLAESKKTDAEAEKLIRDNSERDLTENNTTDEVEEDEFTYGDETIQLSPVKETSNFFSKDPAIRRQEQALERLKGKPGISKHRGGSKNYFYSNENSKYRIGDNSVNTVANEIKAQYGIETDIPVFKKVFGEYSLRGASEAERKARQGKTTFTDILPNPEFFKLVDEKLQGKLPFEDVDKKSVAIQKNLFEGGPIRVGKYQMTQAEFEAMSKEEQENFLKCL